MKVRIKTQQEFEDQYGENWWDFLPSGWSFESLLLPGKNMLDLFGKVIEVTGEDFPLFYQNEITWWCIDKEMIAEFLDESKLEEIPVPVGDFVLKNAKGVEMSDGTYYHYSEVCKLLKLYKEHETN